MKKLVLTLCVLAASSAQAKSSIITTIEKEGFDLSGPVRESLSSMDDLGRSCLQNWDSEYVPRISDKYRELKKAEQEIASVDKNMRQAIESLKSHGSDSCAQNMEIAKTISILSASAAKLTEIYMHPLVDFMEGLKLDEKSIRAASVCRKFPLFSDKTSDLVKTAYWGISESTKWRDFEVYESPRRIIINELNRIDSEIRLRAKGLRSWQIEIEASKNLRECPQRPEPYNGDTHKQFREEFSDLQV